MLTHASGNIGIQSHAQLGNLLLFQRPSIFPRIQTKNSNDEYRVLNYEINCVSQAVKKEKFNQKSHSTIKVAQLKMQEI